MEQLFNGYTLHIPDGAFPLSTDTMALSGFVRLGKNSTVLDLGSGCGSLGLLLCAGNDSCTVSGVELNETAHEAALRNIERNGLFHRLSSVCGDIRDVPSLFSPGSFTCCVSNPPYFSAGPESKLPIARREDLCTLDDLFASAAWALRYGGDFFLVHRPERLAEICACGAKHKLEPKRLCLLRHRSDGPVSLVLLQCRKGGKPGLLWEELSLHHPDGTVTDDYKKLYHL